MKLKTRNFSCKFCRAIFTAKQYLNTQIQFQHKSETSDVIPTMLPILVAFKDQEKTRNGTNLVRDDPCVDVESDPAGIEKSFEKVASTKISSRRGKNQRKSYTIEFIVQTLQLLDALTEWKVKNK